MATSWRGMESGRAASSYLPLSGLSLPGLSWRPLLFLSAFPFPWSAPFLISTRGMQMVALEMSGTNCPSSSAIVRLLVTSSLDKLPVGRESWMSSPRCGTHGKVTKHDPQDLDVPSLRRWLWRVPASVIDKGLAAAVAVAVGVSPRPGAQPVDVSAYVLGLMIAALVLVRRRWPVAVLVPGQRSCTCTTCLTTQASASWLASGGRW
jgi:hypothetical protein